MPGLNKKIVVKIVSAPYIVGDNGYVDVKLFGNPNNWIYRMKIGKTLWHSIYKHLSEKGVTSGNLEYLNGRIITIRGIPDITRSFESKNGKLENPKIFSVSFEYELEDAERIGGEVYKNAVGNAVFNVMCEECIIANSNLAKQKIEKEQTKEIKRKQKRSKENKNIHFIMQSKNDGAVYDKIKGEDK